MVATFSVHSQPQWRPQFDSYGHHMKRILPFIIILLVLGATLGSVWYLTRTIPASPVLGSQSTQTPSSSTSPGSPAPASEQQQQLVVQGVPGAEPAHVLGPANAPVHLEEF